ncbi:MAG: helix-turn-helix domain-containing protein [Pseudomonadota bacterium]
MIVRTSPLTKDVKQMMQEMAVNYGFSLAEVIGESRGQELVHARFMTMTVVRRLTGYSYPRIGKLFGGRDHTSVLHAVRRIKNRMEQEPLLRTEYLKLIEHFAPRFEPLADIDNLADSMIDGAPLALEEMTAMVIGHITELLPTLIDRVHKNAGRDGFVAGPTATEMDADTIRALGVLGAALVSAEDAKFTQGEQAANRTLAAAMDAARTAYRQHLHKIRKVRSHRLIRQTGTSTPTEPMEAIDG